MGRLVMSLFGKNLVFFQQKKCVEYCLLNRFRHLDTKVRLKTTGKLTNGGQSPSPDQENTSKSPKRSPILLRKNNDENKNNS